MSLHSELDRPGSVLRQFFESRLPLVSSIQDQVKSCMTAATTIKPGTGPTQPPWSQIGMAISYRLGFALGEMSIGLASMGAAEAQSVRCGRHVGLFDELSLYLKDVQRQPSDDKSDDEMARICWALALYETIFRAPSGIDSPLWTLGEKSQLNDLLDLAHPAWISDINAMNAAAESALVEPFKDVPAGARRFGPAFLGSGDVGGADADFLLGSCLIEVKATVQTSCEKKWIYQIAGYALFDYDDRYGIDEVALYLARQGLLLRWPLADFLRRMRSVDRNLGLSKPKVDVGDMRNDLRRWLADHPREVVR